MRTTRALIRHFVMVLTCLLLGVPIYMMIVNAFKEQPDILSSPLGLPISRLTIDNIADAAVNGMVQAYLTTSLILIFAVAGALLVGGMLAYTIARQRSWVFRGAFGLLIGGILLPGPVLLIPLIKVLAFFGLVGSPVGLILFYIGAFMPFTVFLLAGFIRAIPQELDQSAMLDGAGYFRIYRSIILPLVRPALAAVGIFLGISVWNDFVQPLVILGPLGSQTVTTGIYRSIGLFSIDFEQVYAYLTLGSVPVMIAYLFAQRHFVDALTQGALKG